MARVLLFGRLADIAGWREREVEGASLAEIRAALGADAMLAEALVGKGVQVAVDKVIVRGDGPVAAGSEVAFMPPMSGG
jgi:molybdopterin synthase sulfur carrier subunit